MQRMYTDISKHNRSLPFPVVWSHQMNSRSL